MPFTDVFIFNSGYGSSMISIKYGVPMITADINEGKNEICARIDYCGLGIDLKTERPRVASLQNAVTKIFNTHIYHEKVTRVKEKLNSYDTMNISEKYILELIQK